MNSSQTIHSGGTGTAILDRHVISGSATIRETLVALNHLSGDSMTLFALDSDGRLIGSVTDGDIRRALIAGHTTEDNVGEIAFRNYISLSAEASPEERYRTVSKANERRINLLPVTLDGRLVDVIDIRRMKSAIPADAVLMAGGRGERLRPLTLETPKPLLKVGGRPIIDYNVESLIRYGVGNIYVTVNYLKEQIISHFEDPKWQGRVHCVEEPCRLGTLGSVALINTLSQNHVIVMNSDLLTNIDFEKLWRHHVDSGAVLTMATVPYTVSVPFAILRIDGDRVTGLEEKPTFNHFANAGVYIIDRKVLSDIQRGEYLDAPDFVESLIARGLKVSHFAIEGTWIDIGSPDDFRYANEVTSRRF
ncbi:MAG: NTP transferase domain-containing protein [Muribaculaceae bacterium]|nr:NTP transferase domain-containing protein [Muribaculaceae bacterium]